MCFSDNIGDLGYVTGTTGEPVFISVSAYYIENYKNHAIIFCALCSHRDISEGSQSPTDHIITVTHGDTHLFEKKTRQNPACLSDIFRALYITNVCILL